MVQKKSTGKSKPKASVDKPQAKTASSAENKKEPLQLPGILTNDALDQESDLADELNTPESEAQELAFDAMEASSIAEARKLSERALALDPNCVDALMVMTDLNARTTLERIDGYSKARAAGERALGEEFMRENMGDFWSMLDGRPYMRALHGLGATYLTNGMHADAIRIFERMLELNSNDDQCVRDPLLAAYLCAANVRGAENLMTRFKARPSANFAWGKVLAYFIGGKLAKAEMALEEARNANSFVELFMTSEMRISDYEADALAPGSEAEAVYCLENVGLAWAANKEAVFWLLEQRAESAEYKVMKKTGLKIMPIN